MRTHADVSDVADTLRIYALSSRNVALAALVACLSLAPVGINAVRGLCQ